MPAQEIAVIQPPATENEENTAPSSQPIVGIIYPPPEVRSMLPQYFLIRQYNATFIFN